MAAHRYWRIKITADSGWGSSGGSSIGEIEMATSQGGADQTTGGTAIASGNSGASWVQANAFDNNTATAWDHEPGSYTNLYIGYDFGSGVTKDIVEVRMKPRTGSFSNKPFTLRGPGAFDVQYSDDGSTWTTSWSVTYPSGTALNRHGYGIGEFIVFTNPSAYVAPGRMYWRIKISTSNGTSTGAVSVQEMEMYASPGGANILSGGTVFADSEWSGGSSPVSRLVDGGKTNGNSWISEFGASYPTPKWIGYHFAAAVSAVESIQIWPRDGFASSQSPADVIVQYSQDSITWTDYWTGTFGTWSEDTPQVLTNPSYVPPVTGRRRQMIN